MSTTPAPSLLDATAAAFAPGQSAHPSPAPSERFSSPSPPLSAVNFQSQFQFQPQEYCGQKDFYGYQPFPLFNGYTQAYEFQATPPPYSAQPQGAASWYLQQNGYVGHKVNSQEPFDDQFRELQGVRAGHIPSQQNTWYHHGTANKNINYSNTAPKKPGKKNKRRKFNRFNKEQHRAEEQKVGHPTESQTKLETDAEKQKMEPRTETATKVKTDIAPETKAASTIGEQD